VCVYIYIYIYTWYYFCNKACNQQLDTQNNRNFCLTPLNAELDTICHLLALLGAHHILYVSRISVKCRLSIQKNVLFQFVDYDLTVQKMFMEKKKTLPFKAFVNKSV